jgi:hypothetical protein
MFEQVELLQFALFCGKSFRANDQKKAPERGASSSSER